MSALHGRILISSEHAPIYSSSAPKTASSSTRDKGLFMVFSLRGVTPSVDSPRHASLDAERGADLQFFFKTFKMSLTSREENKP
jgi:hypothetical protein